MKERDSEYLLNTLDTLAKALAEENHRWTQKERRLYERAVKILCESKEKP